MVDRTLLIDVLWYSGIALKLLLLVRLQHLGLIGTYPVLSGFLGFQVVRSATLVLLLHSDVKLVGINGYSFIWVWTEPLLWVFYFLLILELYSLMMEEFPAVRRLGRLVMYSGLTVVTLICAAIMVLDEQGWADPYPFLGRLVLQKRSVFLALSMLILLLLAFAAHYRLSIRRNVWVLCLCFGSYFLVGATLMVFRRYFGRDFNAVLNLSNSLAMFVAVLGAVFFFSASGEKKTRPISVPWGKRNRELEAALSLQLQSFNQALVKVLRQ